jgi:hypothetical protein
VPGGLHFHDERLVVVGPHLFDHPVLRQRQAPSLRQLLERGLEVAEQQVPLVDADDLVGEGALDHLARGVDAAVEEDRRDDRLEQVGEQRVLLPPSGLLLADTQEDGIPHLEQARSRRQARRADQVGAHLRERSLVELREVAEEQVADDEPEHGIAQELERLVVPDGGVLGLVRVRLVRQCPAEQVGPLEAVAEPFFECGNGGVHGVRV